MGLAKILLWGRGRILTNHRLFPPFPTPDLFEFQVNNQTDVDLLLSRHRPRQRSYPYVGPLHDGGTIVHPSLTMGRAGHWSVPATYMFSFSPTSSNNAAAPTVPWTGWITLRSSVADTRKWWPPGPSTVVSVTQTSSSSMKRAVGLGTLPTSTQRYWGPTHFCLPVPDLSVLDTRIHSNLMCRQI